MTNLKKMTLEHCAFERMNVFLTNYRHKTCVIFRDWTFLTKYWHHCKDFFVKNWKKQGSLLLLLPVIYGVVLTELTFF